MARGTQHRKRRPPANARRSAEPRRPRRRPKSQARELGGPALLRRLRAHAKWVFVLLALVFAPRLRALRRRLRLDRDQRRRSRTSSDVTASSGGSVARLQKKAKKHPKDARRGATSPPSYEQDAKLDDAIAALDTTRAEARRTRTRSQELARALPAPGARSPESTRAQTASRAARRRRRSQPSRPLGKALASRRSTTPIQPTISGRQTNTQPTPTPNYIQYADRRGRRLQAARQSSARRTRPNQLRLAQVAQDAGDTKTSDRRLQAFLKLAPNDSLAPAAKKALKAAEGATVRLLRLAARRDWLDSARSRPGAETS